MNLVISGKNIDITEGLRSAIEEKIGKLERYFNDSTEVHVTLSTEKERQKIEVTIPMKGSMIPCGGDQQGYVCFYRPGGRGDRETA